jgi:Acyl-CoA dehydrogenase, C-terminal domain
MDPADLELFEGTIENATKEHTGPALDAALEDAGWYAAMQHEPRAAIATLFQLQGSHNVASSALSGLVLYALGLNEQSGLGAVLPAIGRWDPPGLINRYGLQVDGLAAATVRDVHSVLVVAASADGSNVAARVPVASLGLEPIGGIDPRSGLLRVTGTNIEVEVDLGLSAPDWSAAVRLSRLAVAHELVGVSRAMLELAREHALARIQFGHPISSFQAVRHRLAETLVAIEMADAMLDLAWLDGSVGNAAMAKAATGRQARTTARHCQQVLAGIGFTTEHPLHLYLQRSLLLDGLFGTATSLTKALGEEIVGSAQLPPLLPL